MTEQAFPTASEPFPWPFTWTPVTQDQFTTAATHIDRRLAAIEKAVHDIRSNMATQADVDALTAALVAEDAELNTAVSDLQASVAAIAACWRFPRLSWTWPRFRLRWRPARPWPMRCRPLSPRGGARSPGDQLI